LVCWLAQTIATSGGNFGQIDLIEQTHQISIRDITVDLASTEHAEIIVQAIRALPDIKVINVYVPLTCIAAEKLALPVKFHSRAWRTMAYTPGVGRICTAIAQDPEQVHNLTIKQNTVAIVTDGSAVLDWEIFPAAACQ